MNVKPNIYPDLTSELQNAGEKCGGYGTLCGPDDSYNMSTDTSYTTQLQDAAHTPKKAKKTPEATDRPATKVTAVNIKGTPTIVPGEAAARVYGTRAGYPHPAYISSREAVELHEEAEKCTDTDGERSFACASINIKDGRWWTQQPGIKGSVLVCFDMTDKMTKDPSNYVLKAGKEVLSENGFKYVPDAYNQGHQGSCVANAYALCNNIHLHSLGLKKPEAFDISRSYIYHKTGVRENKTYVDHGTVHDALIGALTEGYVLENTIDVGPTKHGLPEGQYTGCAYTTQGTLKDMVVPSSCHKIGTKIKLSKCFDIAITPESFVNCIDAGMPILITFPITMGFMALKRFTALWPLPIGGHGMAITGYRRKGKGQKPVFTVQNSWGTDWGNYGRTTMDASYVKPGRIHRASAVPAPVVSREVTAADVTRVRDTEDTGESMLKALRAEGSLDDALYLKSMLGCKDIVQKALTPKEMASAVEERLRLTREALAYHKSATVTMVVHKMKEDKREEDIITAMAEKLELEKPKPRNIAGFVADVQTRSTFA